MMLDYSSPILESSSTRKWNQFSEYRVLILDTGITSCSSPVAGHDTQTSVSYTHAFKHIAVCVCDAVVI